MCPVTPEILLIAKDQKQGKKPQSNKELNLICSLVHLVSKTAQTPAANDAQTSVYTRLKAKPPENQTPPEVLEGSTGRKWQFLYSSSPSHTTYTNSVLKHAHTFFEARSLLFPPVFLFMHLCFLLLAGPGSGRAEQQEWVQPCCWLRSESLCSSDFTAAFQISVPKEIQILI